MQSNTSRATLSAQSSGTPSASTISSSGKQQVVELSGYVIILVENVDGKIKLYGSPPDRDNLEVGDEILEVNGLTLDNISRTEVIRHIHDCIKSCTICLRVRKKNDSRLAWDIGNSVQDAFVIAVEEHARERLQRLAALNRVTPVDITQLSKKLQQTKGGAPSTQKQDLSFLNEASPIYVTSFNSNHTACNSTTLTTAGVAATSTGTAGLISATTVTPTAVASTTTNATLSKPKTVPASGVALSTAIAGVGAAATAVKAASLGPITGNTSIAADRNANNFTQALATTATTTTTPPQPSSITAAAATTTPILTNHNSIYQATALSKLPSSLPHKKLTIARSLQHLEVKEEDDDDDDLAALGANLCNINFINYKNKHAEIPTPTSSSAPLNIQPFVATAPHIVAGASSTLGRRKSQPNNTSINNYHHHYPQQQHPANTVTVSATTVDVHRSAQGAASTAYHDHIPPPLQIAPAHHKVYVDAQTLTSPRLAKEAPIGLPDISKTATTAATTTTAPVAVTTATKAVQALNNNNNNNNLRSLAALSSSAVSKASSSTTTIATNTSNNNNSSQQHLPYYNVHHLGTLQQLSQPLTAAATTIPSINAPSSQQVTSNNSSIASNSNQTSSIISATASTATSATKALSSSSNLSNNCDLYNISATTNNLQQQQQQHQQQQQQQLPPPRRELLTDDDEDETDDILQLNTNSLSNNLSQLNYSPNSSISRGGFELLLGDQSLRQDIR